MVEPNPHRAGRIVLKGPELREIPFNVPVGYTLAKLRRKFGIGLEWEFKFPGMEITTEMEKGVPLQIFKESDISMEAPSIAHKVNRNATQLKSSGQLENWHYNYKLNKTERNNAKVICVIGQTGSGKTTLLNTLINYCLGVQLYDKVRYHLITEGHLKAKKGMSVTNDCTQYEIEGTTRTPPMIVIDTPGFGDTRGMGQDK